VSRGKEGGRRGKEGGGRRKVEVYEGRGSVPKQLAVASFWCNGGAELVLEVCRAFGGECASCREQEGESKRGKARGESKMSCQENQKGTRYEE
jgi:hypothetical protein